MNTSDVEDLPTKTILDEHLRGYGEVYGRGSREKKSIATVGDS
jgi:hypothetical protein